MSTTQEPLAENRRVAASATDTLAASVVIMLVMTVVQRLIGFGRGILFCRWLDAEQLGQWDVAFGFMNLAAPLAVLGLPGSFGRYLEYYRQRGQLHTFLRRTTALCAALGLVAIVAIASASRWFSQLIFGQEDQNYLVAILAVSLAALIAHNFLTSLFIAARMYRVVNALQFFQSLGFAVLSVTLLAFWRLDPASVVLAFGVACLFTSLGSFKWLRKIWHLDKRDSAVAGQRDFWGRLAPFAAWVWMTNLLANLFEVVDRYMIVHHSGLETSEALRQVGYYHTSRIIPLLFAAIIGMLGSMMTPHLTHDWEAGRRGAVVNRLNLTLKVICITLCLASTAVLLVAPWLFGVAFQGKYSGGLAVLPWTLTYCAWFGLIAVAQNYLWCAEQAKKSTLALALGLLLNVALNFVLLPRYGLHGAVWSVAAANFTSLALVYGLSQLHGMRVDVGTWLLSLTPLALCFGPWASGAILVLVAVAIARGNWLLTGDEKQQLRLAWLHGWQKVSRICSFGIRNAEIGVKATTSD